MSFKKGNLQVNMVQWPRYIYIRLLSRQKYRMTVEYWIKKCVFHYPAMYVCVRLGGWELLFPGLLYFFKGKGRFPANIIRPLIQTIH